MPDFLDPSEEIRKYGLELPHWEQAEAVQFVTFRLGDSIPAEKIKQWSTEREIWRTHHPEPWSAAEEQEYHRRFTWRLEGWLDHGAGSCLLKEPTHRDILGNVLMHSHGDRVEHHSWVIMPNHVHLLFTPKTGLGTLMKAWKGTSAHRIGKGSIWQKNYRDTLIRDAEHFANAVRYIRRNPAKLQPGTFTLWEGPRALAVR